MSHLTTPCRLKSRSITRLHHLLLPFFLAYALAGCSDTGDGGGARRAAGSGDEFPYPAEWLSTLDDARARVSFEVLVPSDQLAGEANIDAVYLYPGGMAVALEFPAPSIPKDPIRQAYIEVWESEWLGGDPASSFKDDVELDPADGKSLTTIGGLPALVVSAHSPSDDDRANPAFVRVVINGADVHVSGGEDLDALIRIAEGLIRGAQA